MSTFDEFKKNLTQAVVDLIKVAPPTDRAVVRYWIGRHLGYPDRNPPPKARQVSSRESFVEKLFLAFAEILQSVESLRNVSIYIRRFPYRNAGVEKTAYLRYHMENYLNELYLLENRIIAFVKITARQYRKDPRKDQIVHASKQIEEQVRESFAGLRRTRGAHVHEQRFDDFDLSRLVLFTTIGEDHDGFARQYEEVYRQVRHEKRLWIENTNQSVENLLEIHFNKLKLLLFDDKGNLRIPNELTSETFQPT